MWLLTELFVAPRVRVPPLESLPGASPRVIRVGKRRVRVHSLGAGPLVLLVHGWQGGASQLATLALALRDAGFRVALFDMPGHGAAPGWSTHGREFIELIQGVAAALGPIHALVGHSLGGTAALMAAARGVAPAGVVALSPMPSFEFALRGYARGFGLSPPLRERLAQKLEARIGMRREDFDLGRLQPEMPVLLVHDLLDRAVPARHTRALRESWPSATLFETIGFGHNRGLHAKHVSRAIVAFLLSLPGEQFDEPADRGEGTEGTDDAPSSSVSDAS